MRFKKCKIIVAAFILCLSFFLLTILKTNDNVDNQTDELFQLYADAGFLLKNSDPDSIAQEIDSLIMQLKQIQAPYGLQPEVELLIAKLLYFQGRYEEARSLISQVVGHYSVIMPDWLMLDYACAKGLELPKERQDDIALMMARPILWSEIAHRANAILQDRRKKPRMMSNCPTGLPLQRYQRWFAIAELYEKEKMIHAASEKYICVIYNDYISSEYSDYYQWQKIAVLEKQQQHPRLAYLASLRAILMHPAKRYEITQNWQQPSRAMTENPNQKLSASTADLIALAHNRGGFYLQAIEVLKQSQEPNQKKIKENQKKWEQQVRVLRQYFPTCYQFGQPVLSIDDPDFLKFPMPSEVFWNEKTLYTPKK
ncbi:hypothetical protein [Victivallis sp. Marseille-Q1083]|uniref:hypothetical protein n=1 Tax=Victivallis sp. Marseille-Q1083 TaxID=2717288 RepID=UPI001588693D|nr:hypothetical protein [Victivallis sp. Marseille-Q1083]